jgi:hypothetical protein
MYECGFLLMLGKVDISLNSQRIRDTNNDGRMAEAQLRCHCPRTNEVSQSCIETTGKKPGKDDISSCLLAPVFAIVNGET